MINSIEEISKFNKNGLIHSRLIYSKRKKIKGVPFKEVLSKVNTWGKKDSNEKNKNRETKKKIKPQEAKYDDINLEEIEGMFIDEFC